jgi:hypothetical protein
MIYVALAILLIAFLYFVSCVLNLGLLLSPVAGIVAFFFWRLLEPDERGPRGRVNVLVSAGAGCVIGLIAAIAVRLSANPGADAAGVVVATALAFALYSYRAQGRGIPCALCRLPAPEGAAFNCPRCGDRVCARPTCWNARYARCRRCHEREIVIFPIAEAWWTFRLGRRVMNGECLSCYKEAQETDLRECGQCHWPMCKRCWDYNNGVCRRCEWTIPELPPQLAPFVKTAQRSDRRRQAAAGGRQGSRDRVTAKPDEAGRPARARPDGPPRPRRR